MIGAAVIGAAVIAFTMLAIRKLRGGSGQFDVRDKRVVISGGSQGLGLEIGKQIAGRGAKAIYIIARNEEKLKKAVEIIKGVDGDCIVEYVKADLSDATQTQDAVDYIVKECEGEAPDVVVCNAGSAEPGFITELSCEALKVGVEVNYYTALWLSRGFLKAVKSSITKPRRHIIIISSCVAFFPFIGYGQYAPSKAALRALGDILRHESKQFNVNVVNVYPGNFESEGYQVENLTKPDITKEIEGSSKPITTFKCCEIILNKLDGGYNSITTDFSGFLLQSGMLGLGARQDIFLQGLLGIVFTLIAPIASYVIERDIGKYFKKK